MQIYLKPYYESIMIRCYTDSSTPRSGNRKILEYMQLVHPHHHAYGILDLMTCLRIIKYNLPGPEASANVNLPGHSRTVQIFASSDSVMK